MSELRKRILIIEDEEAISDIIKLNLEREGFAAETAADGQDGLEKALGGHYDLILLDLMLPKVDGYEVCRKVRKSSTVPILIVSAKENEDDKVEALESGADGYVTKPFGMKELMARVKALMRRDALSAGIAYPEDGVLKVSNLVIDLNRYEVKKDGVLLPLTIREFDLLYFLAQGRDQIYSRERLLGAVWGYEYFGDIRTVDVTVRRLREKIEDDPSEPKYIKTKRGMGYYFQPQ